MEIKFSIIISLFNKERYIGRALDSILRQTYLKYEIIIIDAGSTDLSLNIAKKYSLQNGNIFIISQPNQGFSAAKNIGISISNFNYITFLDADDFWNENFLEVIEDLIKKFPNCKVYSTAYKKLYDKKIELVMYQSKYKEGIIDDYCCQRTTGWGLHTSSTVFCKKKLISVGLFPNLIGSVKENKIWLINGIGQTLLSVPNKYLDGRVAKVNVNIIEIPDNLKQINDLMVELPGPIGEDQLVHDYLSLCSLVAFSQACCSNWDGNITGQTTSRTKFTNIYWHFLFLQKKYSEIIKYNEKNKTKLVFYLLYLISPNINFFLKRIFENEGANKLRKTLKIHDVQKIFGTSNILLISFFSILIYIISYVNILIRLNKNEKYKN
jgi:glycosyltransferase involved in cell wall biosynthesis